MQNRWVGREELIGGDSELIGGATLEREAEEDSGKKVQDQHL